ncbi:MAG: cobalamin-binding protein [Acidobacteriota bacterium]
MTAQPLRSSAGGAGPRRIISLTCSNTEILDALGCADRLVGVDNYSDYPPEIVEKLPRVGPDLGIDIEKVASLEPDLILASLTVPGHEKIVEALEEAGLPHIAPAPRCLPDVYRDIRQIAGLLGVSERGERAARDMEAALKARPRPAAKPRIAVQWWPKPVIVPGRQSWVYDLIDLAGGENLIDDDVESRPLSNEEMRDLEPDFVVLAWCGIEFDRYRPEVVYRKPEWQEVPAVVHRRVVPITEAWLGRPSPRLVHGYEALCKLVDEFNREPAASTPAEME